VSYDQWKASGAEFPGDFAEPQDEDDMDEHDQQRLEEIQAWLAGATAKELRFLELKLRSARERLEAEAREVLRELEGKEPKAPRAPRKDKGIARVRSPRIEASQPLPADVEF
jgi:hypothetical protein